MYSVSTSSSDRGPLVPGEEGEGEETAEVVAERRSDPGAWAMVALRRVGEREPLRSVGKLRSSRYVSRSSKPPGSRMAGWLAVRIVALTRSRVAR